MVCGVGVELHCQFDGRPRGRHWGQAPRGQAGREYHKQAMGPQSRETHRKALTCDMSAKAEN